MAGISVSLDGANIQLSFQKDDQATAVVMDARAARALVRAVGQLLTAIDDTDEPDLTEGLGDEEVAMLESRPRRSRSAPTRKARPWSRSRPARCRRSSCA